MRSAKDGLYVCMFLSRCVCSVWVCWKAWPQGRPLPLLAMLRFTFLRCAITKLSRSNIVSLDTIWHQLTGHPRGTQKPSHPFKDTARGAPGVAIFWTSCLSYPSHRQYCLLESWALEPWHATVSRMRAHTRIQTQHKRTCAHKQTHHSNRWQKDWESSTRALLRNLTSPTLFATILFFQIHNPCKNYHNSGQSYPLLVISLFLRCWRRCCDIEAHCCSTGICFCLACGCDPTRVPMYMHGMNENGCWKVNLRNTSCCTYRIVVLVFCCVCVRARARVWFLHVCLCVRIACMCRNGCPSDWILATCAAPLDKRIHSCKPHSAPCFRRTRMW